MAGEEVIDVHMVRKLAHTRSELDLESPSLSAETGTRRRCMLNECGGRATEEWPPRPMCFGELLTSIEAAQYLRLDETGMLTPRAAARTLNYWRDRGELKATKYARCVWFRRVELDRFLERKTEE